MSFEWRYVVRPDGSFIRIGIGTTGTQGPVTDEELARLDRFQDDEEKKPLPPCSRCEGELVLGWRGGPLFNAVWMELCPVCDAHRPAARAFLKWHRDADRSAEDLPHLFSDWESETMQAMGWVRIMEDEMPSGLPLHKGPQPRGRG
ncbi:DUF6300 family protein [Streptomyces sp. NPDC127033]|uniref:DUF6300 family protein n=1 Tax=Streptomyces sp. NPDC127033 TaxID=3347110 RepID=UPI00366702AD